MSTGSGITSGGSSIVKIANSGNSSSSSSASPLRALTEEELLAKDVITPDDVLRLNRFTRG